MPSDPVTRIWSSQTVLGGDSGLAVEPATLTIRGATIVEVTREATPSWGNAPGPHDFNYGRNIVAPAFINAHTHLAMGAFRGLLGPADLEGNVVEDLFFKLESRLTADDIRAFTKLGAYESLVHGVGLVWDHYYQGVAVADAIAETGLCAVVAPTLQDLAGPGTAQLEQQLQATVTLTDHSWAAKGIYAALGPHATDTVSPALWQRVVELAKQHQLPIHAHVAQSVEEYQRIAQRHDTSPMEFLARCGVLDEAPALLAVHAIFVSDSDLDRFAGTGKQRRALGYCPLSQQQFCFPAHVPSWESKAIAWIVATDCAVSNDAMNVQRELAAVAGIRGFGPSSGSAYAQFRRDPTVANARALDQQRVQHLGACKKLLGPEALLKRVWSAPGGLHPAVQAGELCPGSLANLLVLDHDHPTVWPCQDVLRTLAMADVAPAITRLMLRGTWIGGDAGPRSLPQTPQYQAAACEASARLATHLRAL